MGQGARAGLHAVRPSENDSNRITEGLGLHTSLTSPERRTIMPKAIQLSLVETETTLRAVEETTGRKGPVLLFYPAVPVAAKRGIWRFLSAHGVSSRPVVGNLGDRTLQGEVYSATHICMSVRLGRGRWLN